MTTTKWRLDRCLLVNGNKSQGLLESSTHDIPLTKLQKPKMSESQEEVETQEPAFQVNFTPPVSFSSVNGVARWIENQKLSGNGCSSWREVNASIAGCRIA